jgi:broad specificity phosphatase PhoE
LKLSNLPKQDIFIIRHGRTVYNEHGIVQGSGIDASLNETGQEQAEAFYDAYKHYSFDKVYISKLRRTFETVYPFIERGIPHVAHEGLNEICWGDYEGLKVGQVGRDYYQSLMDHWNEGYTHLPIQGGESPECVAARQRAFIQLLRSQQADKQVLVCMHGRAMRVLLCQLLDQPLNKMDAYSHGNLSLYHVRIGETGTELVKADCREHLLQQSLSNA